MPAAGMLRETFVIERPVRTRNEAGESVETWETVRKVMGSYEAVTYQEQSRRGQIGGGIQATVRIHYVDGLAGDMRLRWSSRGDRLLYISAIVEQGHRRELELTVEEQAS